MDSEMLGSLATALIGASCVAMDNLGSYLQLQFDTCLLVIGSAWRLSQGDTVLVGSGDADTLIAARLPALLMEQIVQEVAIGGAYHDLHLLLASGTRVESFAGAASYEQWNLAVNVAGKSRTMIVAGPGSSWALFDGS